MWYDGLAAALFVCGVVLLGHGHTGLGFWMALAGVAFAAGIGGRNIWRGF